ncbi:unnamed protein product [Calypogeia fissa]
MDLEGLFSRRVRWRSGESVVLATGPAVFLVMLLTTTTCSTAVGDYSHPRARGTAAYSRSAYSEFNTRVGPNYLSTVVGHEYSRSQPGRESLRKKTSLRWEETKSSNKKLGEKLRKDEKLDYYYQRVFYVRDNGADPTGVKDSTDAIQKTVNEAFEVANPHSLLPDIHDLGGVEIHLEGGDYLISQPIQFSLLGGGNLRIHGGTIRASDDFPEGRYLLELWSAEGRQRRSNSTIASLRERRHLSMGCMTEYFVSYEDITLRDLMLDSNFRGGGLLLVDSLQITVDNLYFSHFLTDAILVEGSHAVYIQNCFFGQFITTRGADPNEEDFSGVAINLIGTDNVVSNVVIFSGHVGVVVSGQGNVLTGVHAYNKAAIYGGIGIYLQKPGYTQTRILNCYLDHTGIVADDPAQLDISHNYFKGDANVVLRATREAQTVAEVMILNNMFAGSWRGIPTIEIDQKHGTFTYVGRTVVDQNTAYGMNMKSTVAKATISGYGKKFTADLSERLLFPNLIQSVQYSVHVPSTNNFPKHVIRSVSENRVTIETNYKISGTINIWVDQSLDFIYSSSVSS